MRSFISHFSDSRSGFTLFELVAFVAIFSISMVGFVAILIVIVRIQVRQSASAEVTSQSQFLLQAIQRRVEQSISIELPTDVATTTLKLRTASSTDPTRIYLSGGVMYLLETDAGTPQRLTSERVRVADVSFTKRTNSGGKDSVATNFTVTYNTSNPQQILSQFIDSSIARVSAATFDSDIRASSSNTFKIGAATQEWQSINNTIFFGSGGSVGVGLTPAGSGAKFQVGGGNVSIDGAGNGLVLRAAGGSCFLVTISNGGQLATSSVSCP